jgi:uncharacterized protein (TIGR03437 family)
LPNSIRSAMRLGLLALCGFAAHAQSNLVTYTYTFSNLPVRIFPASANVSSTAVIVLPRAVTMTQVTAQVQIQYPNSGDLKVSLLSPQLTQVALLQHDCSVQNIDTTFSDSAATFWRNTCPAAGGGPYKPDQPLSTFNNDFSSFGVWQLVVQNDTSNTNSGWITAFSLTITGTPQTNPITNSLAIANAASMQGEGAIAPGQTITISGLGLGPTTGVSAPAGAWPTTLGGTSVTINGEPSPLGYSSSFQLQVQVPFDIIGDVAQLVVTVGNQSTPQIPLAVAAAIPGLYTADLSGLGQVSAVNQDGSLNSSQHPAPKGSFIAFYASGLGVVSPLLAAGALPPNSPLSQVTGSVGASIGGVAATVQFAGLAPGLPGVYQINVQVPAGAPSGAQELLFFSNGIASQKSVTVEIQ